MNYQDAIERAIAHRLLAKKEADAMRKQALLALAQKWEMWADHCRERAAKGEMPNLSGQPPEDI